MSTVTSIHLVKGGMTPDKVSHFIYEVDSTKPIHDIDAAKEAFSAVIDSKIRLYSEADMHRCWVEAQDSMAKEYGFEGTDEIEEEAVIYSSFKDFIDNGYRP
jgi:hypothetical protein